MVYLLRKYEALVDLTTSMMYNGAIHKKGIATVKIITSEDLASRYIEINDLLKDLEVEKRQIAEEVKARMGETKRLDFVGGHFTRVLAEYKSYPVGVVKALMGDQADEFMKVDKTKLDTFVNGKLQMTQGADKTKWAKVMTHLLSKATVDRVAESIRVGRDD